MCIFIVHCFHSAMNTHYYYCCVKPLPIRISTYYSYIHKYIYTFIIGWRDDYISIGRHRICHGNTHDYDFRSYIDIWHLWCKRILRRSGVHVEKTTFYHTEVIVYRKLNFYYRKTYFTAIFK